MTVIPDEVNIIVVVNYKYNTGGKNVILLLHFILFFYFSLLDCISQHFLTLLK